MHSVASRAHPVNGECVQTAQNVTFVTWGEER